MPHPAEPAPLCDHSSDYTQALVRDSAPPHRPTVHPVKWLHVPSSARMPPRYAFGGKEAPCLWSKNAVLTQISPKTGLHLELSHPSKTKEKQKSARHFKKHGCMAINCRRLETELISAAKITTGYIYFYKIPISWWVWPVETPSLNQIPQYRKIRTVELLLGINMWARRHRNGNGPSIANVYLTRVSVGICYFYTREYLFIFASLTLPNIIGAPIAVICWQVIVGSCTDKHH